MMREGDNWLLPLFGLVLFLFTFSDKKTTIPQGCIAILMSFLYISTHISKKCVFSSGVVRGVTFLGNAESEKKEANSLRLPLTWKSNHLADWGRKKKKKKRVHISSTISLCWTELLCRVVKCRAGHILTSKCSLSHGVNRCDMGPRFPVWDKTRTKERKKKQVTYFIRISNDIMGNHFKRN